MPLHNVTIDDVSALIGYYNPDGLQWKDSPTNDSDALAYYWDHTYHSSNQSGAWTSFRFQGTAVYLFATTRWMHGDYNILMDGQLVAQGNGHTANSVFNHLVYNATNLSPGWYNLTMVNTDPGLYIDVDYIIWTTVMSADLTESSGTPIPFALGNMTYDASVWSDGSGSNPYMETKTSGATVNVTFQGAFTKLAQVDDYEPHEHNAYSEVEHNTLLFRQDNFADGEHTLVVTNRGTGSLAIASARPIIWSNGQDPQGESRNNSTGLIIGVVLGLTLGLTMLVLLWVWFVRRHRAYQSAQTDERFQAPTTYGQTYEATPFIFALSPLGEPTTPQTPYTPGRGSSHAGSPLPTSPGTGSLTGVEYRPGSHLSPSFDQSGSSRPHAYSVPGSQAHSPELIGPLRDRQVVSRRKFIWD
ncbi:unnamed protein product [Rhizoctonia solani]|uniref:Transmembrane protein n=1 Tax=Rhizoctonia solani TaxID=456999 RepID=A0A8H3CYJ1_9AGAM|nr:unnamed protein product [Rhizoctonia solani]